MVQGRRKVWSDEVVRKLQPKDGKRTTYPDPELPAFFARVTPAGNITYVAVAKNPEGKQIWATIGDARALSLMEARAQAREALVRIRAGESPKRAPKAKPKTFGEVSDDWLKRHVRARGLRSEPEIKRIITRYVLPDWEHMPFEEIGRRNVSDLLDRITDDHGGPQADAALRVLRSLANWHASRSDSYVSPFVKGMRRAPVVKRDRVLTDDEIKLLWAATEKPGAFNGIVRTLLLTGQRREKVATMAWADIEDGTWTIQTDAREKGNADVLDLPPLVRSIIEQQPRLLGNPHVFAGRGAGSIAGWTKLKTALDATLPESFPPWVLHDLRRTSRSLMARAGVPSDAAEQVLGHVLPGVLGVYNRHRFRTEKADALLKLEKEITRVLQAS